jgi:hypothetical protein
MPVARVPDLSIYDDAPRLRLLRGYHDIALPLHIDRHHLHVGALIAQPLHLVKRPARGRAG